MKRFDDALKCFELALQLKPNNTKFQEVISRLKTDAEKNGVLNVLNFKKCI
jgi:hypothetical protein